MADNSYTPFNAMVDIVASPGKALDEVKKHTAWQWPAPYSPTITLGSISTG